MPASVHPAGRLAVLAARLFAVDPASSTAVLRAAPARPQRDRWLAMLRGSAAPTAPFRKVPPGIADDRLLGGLDLAATLASGRPIAERGLLAEADGGALLIPPPNGPAAGAGRADRRRA